MAEVWHRNKNVIFDVTIYIRRDGDIWCHGNIGQADEESAFVYYTIVSFAMKLFPFLYTLQTSLSKQT